MKSLILSIIVATALFGNAQDVLLVQNQKANEPKDNIKIINISPDIKKDLIAGETVVFTVELEYNLVTADSATVTLVVQRGESGHMPLANEANVVKKGLGKITISTEIEVPDTKAIQIFSPLLVQGSTQTTIADFRTYNVKP
jgi:hypothetical protein